MELKRQKKRMGEPLWKQCLAWLKDWSMVPPGVEVWDLSYCHKGEGEVQGGNHASSWI